MVLVFVVAAAAAVVAVAVVVVVVVVICVFIDCFFCRPTLANTSPCLKPSTVRPPILLARYSTLFRLRSFFLFMPLVDDSFVCVRLMVLPSQ